MVAHRGFVSPRVPIVQHNREFLLTDFHRHEANVVLYRGGGGGAIMVVDCNFL
jgi:hypothetical protein